MLTTFVLLLSLACADDPYGSIADLKLANIFGVKNAPPDFSSWATQIGAVSIESDDEWSKLLSPQ